MTRPFAYALAGVLTCAAASAQTPPAAPAQPAPIVRQSPRLPSTAVSLEDAVRSTIENDPTLAIEERTIDALVGREQQTSGVFDALMRVGPSASFMQQELTPAMKTQARGLRDTLVDIQHNFTQLTNVMQTVIKASQITVPRCPSNLVVAFGGFSFSNTYLQNPINVDRIDPTEQTLLGTKTFLGGTALGDILGNVTLGTLCTNPLIMGLAPQNYFQVFRDLTQKNLIDYSGGQGLNAFPSGAGAAFAARFPASAKEQLHRRPF